MTKPELRNFSHFLLKGSLSTLGIFFIAYQFSFSNFAKVELDAVKLKAEVEEARGVAYDDFADMQCVVKPKTKSPKPDKATTTDSNPKVVGNKGEKQEAKINPTHHIEYAKCVLAKKTNEQASSIINLTVVFGEFLFIVSALMLAAGVVLYAVSSVPNKKTDSENESEETEKGDCSTSSQQSDEVDTNQQQSEAPKASPEGTGEDEAKQEKDK